MAKNQHFSANWRKDIDSAPYNIWWLHTNPSKIGLDRYVYDPDQQFQKGLSGLIGA